MRRAASRCLFGLAGGGVYPAAIVTNRAVRSYRTISPLPEKRRNTKTQKAETASSRSLRFCVSAFLRFSGGFFSVALSLGSRRVGVTNHRALPSSDFPPERRHKRINRQWRPSGDRLRPLHRMTQDCRLAIGDCRLAVLATGSDATRWHPTRHYVGFWANHFEPCGRAAIGGFGGTGL